MSEDTGVTGAVVEQVNEQVDVADLLGDGNLEEQVDATAIGAAVGREFGASAGRELGETIGREIHQAISEGIEREKNLREIAADVKTATAHALLTGIAGLDGRNSLVSLLRSVGDEDGIGDRLADAVPTESLEDEAEPDVSDEDGAETADETEEGEAVEEDERAADEPEETEVEEEAGEAETEVEEGADEEDAAVEEGADEAEVEEADDDEGRNGTDGPRADELEQLRQETLEDFLELMSYRDLQSVAKDVGVKANLSREEMTDRIVEQVSTGEEA